MNRLLVLMLCLASAGAIAGYTHYSQDSRDTGEPAPPVYTVPQRVPEPAMPPSASVARPIEPGDHVAMARALQRELKRVGCYSGEITGVWTTSSRMAMKDFTERVNATLPIDKPDHVLLSLVRGHQERACGAACPDGETATEGGACVPDAVLATAARDGTSETPSDKGSAALPAAGALAAGVRRPATQPEPNATASDRPAAVKPEAGEAPTPHKKAAGEHTASHGGPVPPEGMRERRRRRTSQNAPPRPPKVVRDFLKVLGFE